MRPNAAVTPPSHDIALPNPEEQFCRLRHFGVLGGHSCSVCLGQRVFLSVFGFLLCIFSRQEGTAWLVCRQASRHQNQSHPCCRGCLRVFSAAAIRLQRLVQRRRISILRRKTRLLQLWLQQAARKRPQVSGVTILLPRQISPVRLLLVLVLNKP
jgi:hypothetical protein